MNPVGLLLVAVGAFSIFGGVFDWDFFMEHRKARLFVSMFGRTGARFFYGLLGLVIVVLGALITVGIVEDAR